MKEKDLWIEYMKKHPRTWKRIHSAFINAQYEKAYEFIRFLCKKYGKKKLMEVYGIKNEKALRKLKVSS